jgi:Tol biopolymer transport system component
MAALAAALLVAGAGLTVLLVTDDGSRGNPQSGVQPNSADGDSAGNGGSASGAQSGPLSSDDLGLPSGPELSTTMLVAAHEVEGNLDLYAVDSSSGATLQRLTSDAGRDTHPLIAPDRTSVIYQSLQEVNELWVVASDGSGARELFTDQPPGCESIRSAAWNPADPSMLAAVCMDAAGTPTLQLVAPRGGVIRTLETGLPTFGGLSFSPDGASLLYWANADAAAGDGALYALATDGRSEPVQLTDPAAIGTAESAIWSPDGTRIACQVLLDGSSDPVNTEVVVMNADGSDPQQLAPRDGIDQDPAWSPDGTMIVFKSDREDANGVRAVRLWLMNSDGSDVRLLSTEGVSDGYAVAWANR